MGKIAWARAATFNWTFDNCGGAPLQDVVCGLWSGVKFMVQGGQIRIPEAVGGGRVYFLRGVWRTDALFAWGGFWVEPEAGGANYYTGGSFQNLGNETVVTLGTALPDGTEVQAYYIYNTGEKTAKYEAMNAVPCMRRAWRAADDYTYDFAVDRIFDAMAAVYFAYRERGLAAEDLLDFFWQTYMAQAASNGSPLLLDNFNRRWLEKGSYLIYANSTLGFNGFRKLDTEIPPDTPTDGRALRFAPSYYYGPGFAAWLGYGCNWDLTQPYFAEINRVKFKLLGQGVGSRVQRFIKTAGSGTAALVLSDGFNLAEVRYYTITVTKTGSPGTAEAILAVHDSDLRLLNDVDPEDEIDGETIVCPSSTAPVHLGHGLHASWQDGTLVVGDTWLITCGNEEMKPHRLLCSLNDSTPKNPEPWGEEHTFVHGIPDYWTSWQEFEIGFEQFWRLGNIIDCRDRKPGRWGNWSVHGGETGTPYEMLFYDVAETNTIAGEVFYTKQKFTWNLNPETLNALGFYVGIPSDVVSTGAANINYLIRHYLAADTTFRTKVRDANGNYFYHDDVIAPHAWLRVSIDLSSFTPESGGTLTHPLNLVDIGLANNPPAQGSFDLLDLKFDAHQTFVGSDNLRVVEFKYQEGTVKLSSGPDWYLDDFGFDLGLDDPYPYAPRLAISLNAYGRNPWRGPTLVHYSHPLAPFLVNRFDIKNTELALHTDAQHTYHSWYGGVPGPILPVHSRNDIENIALCGEENFNRFSWWPRYRDYGKEVASWRFNESMTDKAGTYTFAMTSGSPAWATGICQPGNTALAFDGTSRHASCPGSAFHFGSAEFIVEIVVKFNNTDACALVGRWNQSGNQRSWLLYRNSSQYLCFGYSLDGIASSYYSSGLQITDSNWHHIVVTRSNGVLRFFIDGGEYGATADNLSYFQGNAELRLGSAQSSWPGYLNGFIDYLAISIGRGMEQREASDRWQIIQGALNGSAYPEVGHGLGQYWAFYRLGEYYFVSHDGGAWDLLDNWLTWLDTHLVADGSGWKFPVWFSEYGFAYGDYDPGAAASIAIGALYIYMRNGDARALVIAQRILEDLRRNRASGDYGGYLYKSDYHYAWMNALVAHAFGMAVVGRAGAAYRYPYTSDDETHYQNMMANFWAMSGDTKPNLLNKDLIPYHDCEPHDIWDYAPHYLFMKEMGSMEGVVLMMQAAIDWAKYSGSWSWFEQLLGFMVKISVATLDEQQIFSLNTSYLTSPVATRVSVTYGDYRRNQTLFVEQQDQGLRDRLGEIRQVIPMHYGAPVITEDRETAARIARRALEYFATPKERLQVVADLAAARFDLSDRVQMQAPGHGYGQETFALQRRVYDPQKLRVSLELLRPYDYSPSWAVQVSGSAYDSYAIDTATEQEEDWQYRAYGN
ncbi:MAG: LamG-like jellyroll fold domain-containing protein [Desulfobacca sp.]|uniref:LamG-like jellyroll fold domain-containing protein n=1 Tax=Desulfobacca sp. TaxID=2067990 RepID=UPI00404A8715